MSEDEERRGRLNRSTGVMAFLTAGRPFCKYQLSFNQGGIFLLFFVYRYYSMKATYLRNSHWESL